MIQIRFGTPLFLVQPEHVFILIAREPAVAVIPIAGTTVDVRTIPAVAIRSVAPTITVSIAALTMPSGWQIVSITVASVIAVSAVTI